MNRDKFIHAIRAAAEVSREDELVVVGSLAILATTPDPPQWLSPSLSIEVDLYGTSGAWDSEAVDAVLGNGSPFFNEYGFYVDAVDSSTAALPPLWRDRAIRIQVDVYGRQAVAICPEIHDLALSKYIAAREKDRAFARLLAQHGLTKREVLLSRADEMSQVLDKRLRAGDTGLNDLGLLKARIMADFESS